MSFSGDPNAPQIPLFLYLVEKGDLAGDFIGLICYGISVVLFFQCMGVLLSPTNTIDKRMKWALIVHAVTMFCFLTIPIGLDLNERSVCYIDRRNFPGDDQQLPGPLGCGGIIDTEPSTTAFNAMFPLNQWLADGLLLYRCYAIYFMNRWIVAFPCAFYLASVVIGILYIYEGSGPRVESVASINFATAYFSICLALNVVLTLMIVTRLIMHVRGLRKTTGAPDGSGGLYTVASTVITMLIESYALYAAALLLYIVPWALNSWVLGPFSKAPGPIQVIAPYLIILRVANRRALTSKMIASGSGDIGSMQFRSQGETTGGGESIPDGDLTSSMMEASGEPGFGTEDSIEEVAL